MYLQPSICDPRHAPRAAPSASHLLSRVLGPAAAITTRGRHPCGGNLYSTSGSLCTPHHAACTIADANETNWWQMALCCDGDIADTDDDAGDVNALKHCRSDLERGANEDCASQTMRRSGFAVLAKLTRELVERVHRETGFAVAGHGARRHLYGDL